MENQNDLTLANAALHEIGEARIMSLDNTVQSRKIEVVNDCLPRAKQATLRARDWNSVRGRVTLAALDAEVLSLVEWSQAYRLPADFLCMRRFISRWDDEKFAAYSVEIDSDDKRILFTECGTNKIVYTRNITNPTNWASDLFDTCVLRLAWHLAGPLMRDLKEQQNKIAQLTLQFDEAIGTSEGEGGINQVYDGTLVSVRF